VAERTSVSVGGHADKDVPAFWIEREGMLERLLKAHAQVSFGEDHRQGLADGGWWIAGS